MRTGRYYGPVKGEEEGADHVMQRRMVELPVLPYILCQKLMVFEQIFDIFGMVIVFKICVEFAHVMLALLGAGIEHVESAKSHCGDGQNEHHALLLFASRILYQEE